MFVLRFLLRSRSRAEMERYTAALCREIVQAGREYPGAEVSTVYLGGGTPSILPPDLMASVLESLRGAFSFEIVWGF